MNLADTNTWLVVTQAFGAIGTICSLLWAIHIYHNENDKRSLMEIKNSILKIPHLCNEVNMLLSEPFFAALGNSIADELKNLHEKGQSLEDFSNFLLDDVKSHNYKAQAIYSGLKRCDEVAQIKEMLKQIEESERVLTLRFSGIGLAVRKLVFYVERSATRTISSRILNQSLSAELDEGIENDPLKEALQSAAATGSEELYFKELGIYITSVTKSSLRHANLGQRTIDLSLVMIEATCSVFGEMELNKLKAFTRKDKRIMRNISEKHMKHAVEDAMVILKQCKKYYAEDRWDRMIECKGRIIENMENDDE